jgi:hypothetical protein
MLRVVCVRGFGRDIQSLHMGLSGVCLGRGGLGVVGGMDEFLWGIGLGSGGSCKEEREREWRL